jgi:2-dehydro-3-deoxygluconokinase
VSIVCFGEVLCRLSPPEGRLLFSTDHLAMTLGGAEANVAASLARLGAPAKIVSVLPDNDLGRAAIATLRGHGVDTSALRIGEGRMGLYFMTPPAGLRPAEVLYDRGESAFARAPSDLIDWPPLLRGASWLHLSGVTPALGERAAAAALRAAHAAQQQGTPVSFDSNYRSKLWGAWRTDGGSPILRDLMQSATLAFANERDIGLVLGASYDNELTAVAAAFAAFPNLQRVASTIRTHDADRHTDLSAFMITRDGVFRAGPLALGRIVDRIGAGDAFAAGLLYSIQRGADDPDALAFALAAAALKHGVWGDVNLASEADVRAVLAGDAPDVRR